MMHSVVSTSQMPIYRQPVTETLAFVIAWGDMSAQSMRTAGLTRLSLDLKALSVRRWELYVMWVFLFASLGEPGSFHSKHILNYCLVLMFVSNGLSSGVLVSVSELRNIALCYRRQ